MKLTVKTAGLCASGAFLITALPPFFTKITSMSIAAQPLDAPQSLDIIETIIFSLIGAFVAGVIGYLIGDILAHPQGKTAVHHSQKPETNTSTLTDLGNETFLADLEPLPLTSDTEENLATSVPDAATPTDETSKPA
ncbi:MAG TPA: hypothetical protein V6C99_04640 [Oculatellaceae cyanobacterium]|jgi:hypothetical protein